MLYSTTANLICIDFYVYFPQTAQTTAYNTVQCAVVFDVFPKNAYYVSCPVTSLRRQNRLYLQEWDLGRKERTFVLRKSS